MRFALDIALFVAVFAFTYALFQNVLYAAVAGLIIALAGDTLVWTEKKR